MSDTDFEIIDEGFDEHFNNGIISNVGVMASGENYSIVSSSPIPHNSLVVFNYNKGFSVRIDPIKENDSRNGYEILSEILLHAASDSYLVDVLDVKIEVTKIDS